MSLTELIGSLWQGNGGSAALAEFLPCLGIALLGISFALGLMVLTRVFGGGILIGESINRARHLAGISGLRLTLAAMFLGAMGLAALLGGPRPAGAQWPTPPQGTVPLYRLTFDGKTYIREYYTHNRTERDQLVQKGWVYQQVVCYVYPTPWRFAPGDSPADVKVEPIEPQPPRPPREQKPTNDPASIVGTWSWPGAATLYAWPDGRVVWYKGGTETGTGRWTLVKPRNFQISSASSNDRCEITQNGLGLVCYTQQNQRFEANRIQ